MHVPRLLSLLGSLVAAAVSAAAAPSNRLAAALKQRFPLPLGDRLFAELTAGPSRDYAAVVLLTAMDPKFGCNACREFMPEWQLLARSWQRGDAKGDSRTVLATLDFADGRQTFQQQGLSHAPVILVYPPTEGPNARPDGAPIRYDFSGMATAESIHAWISRTLPAGPKPPVVRPFNYVKAVVITTAVLGGITFVTVAAPYIGPVLQNRNVWAALSLLAVLLFTSGHMFNHIRKVPYVAGDGRGGVAYFAGGFQNQYGMETQIVAGVYGVLSFAAINLALKCPRIADPASQQVAVVAWTAGLFVVYSFLLNIFRWKNGGYPFYLPPF